MKFLNLNFNKALKVLEDFSNISLDNYEDYIDRLSYVFDEFKDYIGIDASSRDVVMNTILISMLKNEHVKVTDEQNRLDVFYRGKIDSAISNFRRIIDVVCKIKSEDIYIDSSIIDLLKIDKSVSNLRWIIFYNKRVNQKKNSIVIEEIVDTSIKENEQKVVVQKVQKKKRKRVTKRSDEIVFKDFSQIVSYIYDNYGIVLESTTFNKSIDEMSSIINLLRQKSFNDISLELLEMIFDNFSLEDISLISKILNETCFNSYDIYDICKSCDCDVHAMLQYIYEIGINPFYSDYDEKIKILKCSSKIIVRSLKNSLIFLFYNLVNYSDNSILSKKINVEYIDQIIETGAFTKLVKSINNYFDFFNIPPAEGAYPRTLYEKIYNEYFSIINKTRRKKCSRAEAILELNSIITNQVKAKNFPIQNDINKMYACLLSHDEILSVERDISKMSLNNIDNVFSDDISCDNVYLNYLDNKYLDTAHTIFLYKIPTDKYKVGLDNIFVSRNKVFRLLKQHILNGDEITVDVVVNCIFYNMIITDELLENAREKITLELKSITPIQKMKKSIK